MSDKVNCEVCGKPCVLITLAHIAKHGFTSMEEYQAKFPDAKFSGDLFKKIRSPLARKQLKAQWSGEENYFNMFNKVHGKVARASRKKTIKDRQIAEGNKEV